MNLTFLGATETVTGSKYLVTSRYGRVLVDCGLFQGFKHLRARNRRPFPVAAANIDAIILTHAHIDHSGYLPLLVRQGFRGRVYCTAPTADLCRIMLLDSARLQEEEAKHANRRRSSRHHPALPLYTTDDALRAIDLLRPVAYHETVDAVAADCFFRHAGHIIGAASALLNAEQTTLAFSGDLGRADDPLMLPPESFPGADYAVVESTYGDRTHPASNGIDILETAVTRTIRRSGTVVIPAFAVGRAQLFIMQLDTLRRAGRIPDVPIYLDSPMASEVTDVVMRYASELRVPKSEFERALHSVHVTADASASRALDASDASKIIISASGMATGGRVLFHLQRYAPGPHNLIVLGGFQSGGTRGAAIAAGAKEVKIFGQFVPIRAEVVAMTEYSSHADAVGIISWLKGAPSAPIAVFVTHGEPAQSDGLRKRIQWELQWNAIVPEHGQSVDLKPPALLQSAPDNREPALAT
jgi:metallo-beta-lactamase family protein